MDIESFQDLQNIITFHLDPNQIFKPLTFGENLHNGQVLVGKTWKVKSYLFQKPQRNPSTIKLNTARIGKMMHDDARCMVHLALALLKCFFFAAC